MADLIYKDEAYTIVGVCMEVHKFLGHGFLEIVYKDAIQYELKQKKILFEREKEYPVPYKEITLPHKFYADFVVYDKIILEIKAKDGIADEDIAQAINYCRVSGCKLSLVINFGRMKLDVKRIVY